MTTPNFGWPFPTLGQPPNGPAAFQSLATAIDADVHAIAGGLSVQAGYRVAAVDGSGMIAFTFTAAFASVPVAAAALADPSGGALVATLVHGTLTPTGASCQLKKADGTTATTGTYRIAWWAVGAPA